MDAKETRRLLQIQKGIYSLMQGVFNYRIARTNEDDLIESIAVMVNMMAEEMKETLHLYSDLHLHQSQINALHLVFILDMDYRIRQVTPDVFTALGYKPKELVDKSFSKLLSENSRNLWRSIASDLLFSSDYNSKHQLLLSCKNKSERSYNCGITSFFDETKKSRFVVISMFDPLLKSIAVEDKKMRQKVIFADVGTKRHPAILLKPADRKALHSIYLYILQNLDKPLPHLEEIAHSYGINEYKLKYGFKELFGTSVFRFLKQERLKKARLLIENTNTPIHKIAEVCGYPNRAHFSKEFSNFFDISPRMVRKQR